jgi:hypothetical protein
MTPILWSAIGMAAGAVILHTALGVHRPFDRTYLAFACMMLLVTIFLYLQWKLYRATSGASAVELKQHQVTLINLFYVCMFVFVPAYTKVRLPRVVSAVLWGLLALAFVGNILLPYGLWFSAEPTLVPSTFLGEPYNIVVTPPMGAPQLAFAFFATGYVIIALACAAKMYRRGVHQRAVTFAFALTVVIVYAAIDIIRDNVGGTWPYMVEYGLVSWALIVSVQLAHDFRDTTRTLGKAIEYVDVQARQLTEMLNSLHVLEHNMKIPLETLETGVVGLGYSTTAVDPQLRRVERATTRLRELARLMPEIRLRR